MHHRSHAKWRESASRGDLHLGDLHPAVVCTQRWSASRGGLHPEGLHPGGVGKTPHPRAAWDTVNKRAVHILLEYILVFFQVPYQGALPLPDWPSSFPFFNAQNSQVFALMNYADWPIRSIVSEPVWVFPWSWLVVQKCVVITARKRSLGQRNIFTPVCHSVHRGRSTCVTFIERFVHSFIASSLMNPCPYF